jgi:hypothetical protein
MTDLSKKMIASSKWFYLVFFSIGLYTQPSILQKKYSVSLVWIDSFKST